MPWWGWLLIGLVGGGVIVAFVIWAGIARGMRNF